MSGRGGGPRGLLGMGLNFLSSRDGTEAGSSRVWVAAKWDGAEAGRAKLDLFLERVRRRESTGHFFFCLGTGPEHEGCWDPVLGRDLRGPHGA